MGRKKTTIQQDVAKLAVIVIFLLFLINPEKTKLGLVIVFIISIIFFAVSFIKKQKLVIPPQQNNAIKVNAIEKPYYINETILDKKFGTKTTSEESVAKPQNTAIGTQSVDSQTDKWSTYCVQNGLNSSFATGSERTEIKVKLEKAINPKEVWTIDFLNSIELAEINAKLEKEIESKELWTIDFLNSIEWRRYEDLCKMFLELKGYIVKATGLGADGGIDINIYEKNNLSIIYAIAQCKSYTSYDIGVKSIREFYGIMAAEQINHGFFFTTSNYTSDAIKFANGKGIQLINGKNLIDNIHKLENSQQMKLYNNITVGDYKTPSCPKCGLKMKLRTNNKDCDKKFWGCSNFPRCRSIIKCSSVERNKRLIATN